jgi:hypothetical protein
MSDRGTDEFVCENTQTVEEFRDEKPPVGSRRSNVNDIGTENEEDCDQ